MSHRAIPVMRGNDRVRIACPDIPRHLPHAVRVRLYELVLTGQIGLVDTILQIDKDHTDDRQRVLPNVHTLMALNWTTDESPRNHGLAA